MRLFVAAAGAAIAAMLLLAPSSPAVAIVEAFGPPSSPALLVQRRRTSSFGGAGATCPTPFVVGGDFIGNAATLRRSSGGASFGTALNGWFDGDDGDSKKKTKTSAASKATVKIGEHVGSGSYGTVHAVTLEGGGDGGDADEIYIGKRAWTYEELSDKAQQAKAATKKKEKERGDDGDGDDEDESSRVQSSSSSGGSNWKDSDEAIRERAKRCKYYIDVERHCLAKLNGPGDDTAATKDRITELVGTHPDTEGREWIVFRTVARGSGYGDDSDATAAEKSQPALSLSDAMELDWADQHAQDPAAGSDQHHHLYIVQREMGLPPTSTFADTLDAVLRSLLRALVSCHSGNVVHRDVKPQNLLCDAANQGFVLIDFGSAADLDPKKGAGGLASALGGNGGRVGLEDSSIVAVSPIYAAPETFVRWDRAPLNFDTFSCALIFCQLLFNLLDERTDAAFHQQLEFAKYDLDTWLEREFESTMLPAGVDDALAYLAQRPGLWRLLIDMFNANPERRASSEEALRRFDKILAAAADKGTADVNIEEADGEFFASIIRSIEQDEIIRSIEQEKENAAAAEKGPAAAESVVVEEETVSTEPAFVVPRPLHYVASFARSVPLGLILAEYDPADDETTEDDDQDDDADAEAWERATRGAKAGEVYVKGIAEGGQADEMGIFEVGDRLRAVGEVPVFDNGFGFAVDMIGKQPRSAKTVKLHFDRRSVGRAHKYKEGAAHKARVVGQGAWSSTGGRAAQEDMFVLHEINDDQDNAVLMAAVFDGHGGAAASKTCSQLLPSLFAAELATIAAGASDEPANFREILEESWDVTCNTYRSGCSDNEECTADYDPSEGIVMGSMTAKDLVAGTTAAATVLSVAEDGADTLTVLNCGDSRSLLVGRLLDVPKEDRQSVVHFSTRDHTPYDDLEIERLKKGILMGYSQPRRSMSRVRVPVGDYSYGLSRSLEGPFATSRGIVSDPDVTDVNLVEMLSERDGGILVIASDGMFEVMDNEQVGREVLKMREAGRSANDAAKYICRMANEKGTSDNVSAVIVYLD